MNDHYSKNNSVTSNRLLGGLPNGEFERFGASLELVDLKFGSSVYDLDAKITHVYFPNSGIISLLAAVEKSSTLEVGIVGFEGMVGLPVFLGVDRSQSKAIVQGTGTAMRMNTADLERECNYGGALPTALKRFTHSMIVQISQSAVCFRFHVIEMRLARWLLMTSDRTESNEFAMTQEFLSHMLGVRREAVNRAAMSLQRKELISYSRNNILIIDRPGLEATACKCYSIICEEESNNGNALAT